MSMAGELLSPMETGGSVPNSRNTQRELVVIPSTTILLKKTNKKRRKGNSGTK